MRGPYYVIPKGGPFSFIEKAVKGVARSVVPGFSAAESLVKGLQPPKKKQTGVTVFGPTVTTPKGYGVTVGSINLPGGLGLTLPGFGEPQGSGSGCPAGYHPAKDGSGRCVRNRRTNYSNGRAAQRAVRRVKGSIKQLSSLAGAVGKKVVRSGGTSARGKKK